VHVNQTTDQIVLNNLISFLSNIRNLTFLSIEFAFMIVCMIALMRVAFFSSPAVFLEMENFREIFLKKKFPRKFFWEESDLN
jgi:hypothetical protein